MPETDILPEKEWGFAARRFASGKRPVQVAQALGKPVAIIEATLKDAGFAELVECYETELARTDEDNVQDMRQAVVDGLNWLIEQRDVRTVLWVAGKMGVVGALASDFESGRESDHPLGNLKMGPWDEVFEQMPPEYQLQYLRDDPSYVPPWARPAEARSADPANDDGPWRALSEERQALAEDGAESEADMAKLDGAAEAPASPPFSSLTAQTNSVPNHTVSGSKPFTHWRKEPLPPHLRPQGR